MAKVVRRRSTARKRTAKRGRARPRVRITPRTVLLGGLLLGLLVGLAWLRGALVERLVQVVLVQEGLVDRVVAAPALVSRRETVVLAPVDGSVHWLAATGDRVRAGQVVAELASPEAVEAAGRELASLEERLAELRASQAPALETLAARQVSLGARLGEAAGRLRVAATLGDLAEINRRQAEVEALAGEYQAAEREKQDLEKLLAGLEERVRAQRDLVEGLTVQVAAPLAGVVVRELDGLEQSLAPGQATRLGTKALLGMTPRPAAAAEDETVRAASPLFKVVDSLEIYLCLALPAAEGESLPPSLRVRFPTLGGRTARARIHHRGERERNGLAVVVVELTEAPDELALARTVEAELVTDTYHGPLVPRRALLRRDGATGVMVVVRNAAWFRPVEILGGDGQQVVVRGIEAGAEVVLNPWLVREGVQVR